MLRRAVATEIIADRVRRDAERQPAPDTPATPDVPSDAGWQHLWRCGACGHEWATRPGARPRACPPCNADRVTETARLYLDHDGTVRHRRAVR